MCVILWRLELNRKVARYLIKERFFKLLDHLLRRLSIEAATRAHIRHEHEISEIEADQEVARVFLTLDGCQDILNKHNRMGDSV